MVQLEPVGVVRNGLRDRKSMPALGAPASVEIFEPYRDALLRFEKHSHVWVLAWLDRGERNVLQVTPRGVDDRGPDGLHGVFAVRSPARPNPIGLTLARVLGRDGLHIALDRLDFLDGTPVIDLKPYFVTRDLAFTASNSRIGLPRGAEALRDSLVQQAVRFHGEECADLALAVRMVEDLRIRFHALGEPERWVVEVPLCRPCLIDAMMGMTRTSPGRNTLRFTEQDAAGFAEGRYWPRPELPGDFEAMLEAPSGLLFDFELREEAPREAR